MQTQVPRRLRVFLCHANTDKPAVQSFGEKLSIDGFEVWLDAESLIPGQDWRVEIPRAISAADVVIVFLSQGSISREGYVQKEIKFALDVADEKPEDTIYIIPAKLEECQVPERLNRWQWVELYKENGYERLVNALRKRATDANLKPILTPRLSIRAFGNTQVKVYGRNIMLSDWKTQSVRDLFFYLLTKKEPLTKEQIASVLWPDIDDPQKLKLRFRNDIYRLRRAVGQEVITYEDVFYSFNRSLDFEYDVEAFESFLARAKSTKNLEERVVLYQRAVDLVHGPFLDDIYADWTIVKRERLSQTYLSALLTLSELFQKQAQPEQALAICRRALDYDPTFEAVYSLSMRIYHRMGDRASIIRTYQAVEEVLHRQLGLPPAKETEELYRRLIA